MVHTHRGQVRELWRPPLWNGKGLSEEEGGPQRGEGLEVPTTQVEPAGRGPRGRRTLGHRRGGRVDSGAEEDIGIESSSGEEMQEYGRGGSGCRLKGECFFFCFFFLRGEGVLSFDFSFR